jgi:hypothetical protein
MMCPRYTFIHAVRAKVQPSQPEKEDDTSINSIEIKCKHPKPGSTSTLVSLDYGQFGIWSDWVEYDKYICGGQARYDWTEQGKDATGLNGLRFKFCSYNFNGLEYEPIYTGIWGEWLKPVDSPYPDFFACGAGLVMHPDQGNGDDSAANELKLVYCKKDDWRMQEEVIVNTGLEGEWKNTVMCPKDHFINGGSVSFQENQEIYGDDTALNGFKIKCQHATASSQKSEETVESKMRGEWKTGSTSIDGFVCGAQVRFDSTPFGRDATALNGIAFKYCKIEYDFTGYQTIYEGLKGEWLIPIIGPTGYYACGMRVRNHPDQGPDFDDSSVNAIDLVYCAFGTWSFQVNTLLNDGLVGDWKEPAMCSKNSYIHAISLRIEPENSIEKDKTAVNGVKFKCLDSKPDSKSVEVIAESGNTGDWSDYVEFNKYVCGAQVRFDFTPLSNSKETDATAMSGLKAKFCDYEFTGPYYEVVSEGYWGSWFSSPKAQKGYAACGFSSKVQNSPINNDIIGVTALRIIYCKMNEWTNQLTVNLNDSSYGEWKDPVMCPKGSYINGAQAKVEEPQETKDDSSFNRLNFKCTNPLVPYTSQDVMMQDMDLGTWSEWVSYPDKYVCGAEVRSDNTIPGDGKDATGLNGLSLKFCKFEYDTTSYITVTEGLKGEWINPVEFPEGYYACGMAISNHADQKNSDYTAINAIKIFYCNIENWDTQLSYNLNEGFNGEWADPFMCEKNTYIHGARAKVQPNQDTGDDLALNTLELECRYRYPVGISKVLTLENDSSGKWGEWVESQDKYVCGGQARFYRYTISTGNYATALKGLKLKFCTYPYSKPMFDVVTAGYFGEWMIPYYAPQDYLACGISLRVQTDIGNKDNTVLEAVRFTFCHIKTWDKQEYGTLNQGYTGEWKDAVKCPKDSYINGVSVKLEEYQRNGDNSSAIGIKIGCLNPKQPVSSKKEVPDPVPFGVWTNWVEYPDSYVCAGQVRYEEYNSKIDNTALNGLSLKFCKYDYDVSSYDTVTDGILGDWLNPVEAPAGMYACGMAARNQPFQGDNDDTALNAIKFIFCSIKKWENQVGYELNQGLSGEWNDNLMCPKKTYVSGVRAKVVPSKGSDDDTAMNDIFLKCSSPQLNNKIPTISYDFSSEGDWTEMLEKDQFICGGQVRFDPTTSDKGDATALNGLRVKFCPYLIPDDSDKSIHAILEEGKQGSWLDFIDAPTKTLACGVAIKYSPDVSTKGNYPIDAIKLIYCGSDWDTQSEKNINDGMKGKWKKSVLCPKSSYIHTARAKIEPINGPFVDEFVLSGIEFKCLGISTTMIADNGGWGTWREWVEYEDRFVCGGAAKYNLDGTSQNGTGVFGLRLSFCKAPF